MGTVGPTSVGGVPGTMSSPWSYGRGRSSPAPVSSSPNPFVTSLRSRRHGHQGPRSWWVQGSCSGAHVPMNNHAGSSRHLDERPGRPNAVAVSASFSRTRGAPPGDRRTAPRRAADRRRMPDQASATHRFDLTGATPRALIRESVLASVIVNRRRRTLRSPSMDEAVRAVRRARRCVDRTRRRGRHPCTGRRSSSRSVAPRRGHRAS